MPAPTNTPTPLSLIFGPKFGVPHQHPDGEVRYYVDRLAGHTRVFRPVLPGELVRTVFELGRHKDCWLRIGWETVRVEGFPRQEQERRDEAGYPIFGAISRVMVTFVWADATTYPWLSESKWLVLPGGVFVGADGQRESSGARNGVWLNGKRLEDGDNPEPLFPPGQQQAKLSLALTGKIIVIEGPLDEHSTGWPAEVWDGHGWPLRSAETDTVNHSPKRLEVEAQVAEAKSSPAPNTPWFVPAILDPGWLWFKSQPRLLQVLVLVLVAALVALWIVER